MPARGVLDVEVESTRGGGSVRIEGQADPLALVRVGGPNGEFLEIDRIGFGRPIDEFADLIAFDGRGIEPALQADPPDLIDLVGKGVAASRAGERPRRIIDHFDNLLLEVREGIAEGSDAGIQEARQTVEVLLEIHMKNSAVRAGR